MAAELNRAISLQELGRLVLAESDDYAAALRCFHDALLAVEASHGQWQPLTANILVDIGLTLARQGDFEAGRLRLWHALAIQHLRRSVAEPDMPYAMTVLGSTFSLQDNYDQAALWYGRAIDLLDRIHGPHHPQRAIPQAGLEMAAWILRLKNAESPPEDGGRKQFTRVLADYRFALGPLGAQLEEGHPAVDLFAGAQDDWAAMLPQLSPPNRRVRFRWRINRMLMARLNTAARHAPTVVALAWVLGVFGLAFAAYWGELVISIVLGVTMTVLAGATFSLVREQPAARRWAELSATARRGAAHPYDLGQEAIAALDWAVRDRRCKDPYRLWARANVLSMLGRSKEAEALYTLLIKQNPDDPAALRYRGAVRIDLRQPAQALNDLDRAIALDGLNTFGLCLRGQALERLGHVEDGVADFTRAIEIDCEGWLAWYCRGKANHLRGYNEQAIIDLDEALRISPTEVNTLAWRGAAKRMLEQYEDAIADLDEALKLDANNQVALRERGETNRMLDRHGEALADFDLLLTIAPDHQEGWCGRGEVRRERGQYDEAIADLDRAIQLDPNDDFALASRGSAKRTLGHHDEALNDLNRALEINPHRTLASEERDRIRDPSEFRNAVRRSRARLLARGIPTATDRARESGS